MGNEREGISAELGTILSRSDSIRLRSSTIQRALALAEAKKRFPEVPFLLVTGALDEHEERMDEILAGGASDYILKDHLDQLAPAVHKALCTNRGT